MTTDDVLEIVRQRVGQAVQEIGGEAPSYGDDFLLRYIKTVNFHLMVLGIVTGVTVDTINQLISPDANIPIGLLLASGAAASLIKDDVLSRLKRGELGIAFSTGATSISTNQAAISLRSAADQIYKWHDLLLTAFLSGDPYGVIQRVDAIGFDVFGGG